MEIETAHSSRKDKHLEIDMTIIEVMIIEVIVIIIIIIISISRLQVSWKSLTCTTEADKTSRSRHSLISDDHDNRATRVHILKNPT